MRASLSRPWHEAWGPNKLRNASAFCNKPLNSESDMSLRASYEAESAADSNDPEGLHQRLHHHLAHGLSTGAGHEGKAAKPASEPGAAASLTGAQGLRDVGAASKGS